MNLRVIVYSLFASLLLLVQPVNAQAQDGTTVGIGVSINAPSVAIQQGDRRGTFSLAPFTVTVPITTSSIRLEPEVGFARSSRSANDRSSTSAVFTIGTGLFAVSRFENTLLHLGGRVGLSRLSETRERGNDEESSSRVNFSIGPAIGGEYYLSDHFSLGLEAQFVYVNVGEPDDAPDDFSASQLRTSGVAFFRAHF